MEKKYNEGIYSVTGIGTQLQSAERQSVNTVKYMSRNKFLIKYGFSATIFDKYIETGRIPFHRTGKVVEVEENRTLEILKKIETENADVARAQSIKNPIVKPVPIVVTGENGVKIRRKKLDA